MHHPGGGDPAATWQSGRRRALLEHRLEHRLRPARHGKPLGEDHNWRRRSVHADRVDAQLAGIPRRALNPGVDPGHRTSSDAESIARSGSIAGRVTSGTRDFARSTSSITRGDEVVRSSVLVTKCGYNARDL